MTDASNELDKDFLLFIIKSLVDHPGQVIVDRKVDDMGVLLTLTVHPEDMGKIIGRDGNTAKALRTLLRVVGSKSNVRVNMKINEPEREGEGRPESAPENENRNETSFLDDDLEI